MLTIKRARKGRRSELDADPIKALSGCAKGENLTEKLLKSRKEDLELEAAKRRKG